MFFEIEYNMTTLVFQSALEQEKEEWFLCCWRSAPSGQVEDCVIVVSPLFRQKDAGHSPEYVHNCRG